MGNSRSVPSSSTSPAEETSPSPVAGVPESAGSSSVVKDHFKRDINIINARLVGVQQEALQGVKVRNGKVTWIGKTASLEAEGSEVVDVKGRWLAPSMIDNHIHSKLAANHAQRVDLQACRSARAVFDTMQAALSDPRYSHIALIGTNMRNGNWTDDHLMSREQLDQNISSTRPIFLYYNGYHTMVCNSPGLTHVDIKAQGHSGHLLEHEAWEPTRKIGVVADEIMDEWVLKECERAAQLGVTEVVDLEIDFNIPDWIRRCENGFDLLRVHVGIYEPHLEDCLSRGLKSGDFLPGTNDLVDVGPFKIVTDGGLGSQTAYCHEPYPGTDDYGIISYTREKLRDLTQDATERGFTLAIHAIGDECNTIVLDTLASNPSPPLPGSTIEHAQLLKLSDIAMFTKLGLIASVQPRHLVDDRETCLKYWPGREGRAWALKSLKDGGVPMKFGSDSPVAVLNPWEAMAVAISRSGEEGLTLSAEQAIDIETAWVSSTSNGAMSIREGDTADLMIIDRDPLLCDATKLRGTVVYGTILGGRFTHRLD